MQTSIRTPRKNIPTMFSRGFVTNNMYLMAGESLSKSGYQKSVKSKMAANDCLSVNVGARTDIGRGSLKQPAI